MGEIVKNLKSQPWIHSWYGDTLGFFTIPILFVTLAFFNLPPFNGLSRSDLTSVVYAVLILDWGHIFAQWYRIFLNPAETRKAKYLYTLSYFILIPILALLLTFFLIHSYVESFLVYFVIYHFIRQHYGFIRIYSKIDGVKSKMEVFVEGLFIYLSMWTPVIFWHIEFPFETYYWVIHFIKLPYAKEFFQIALCLYFLSSILFLYFEYKRFLRTKVVNTPKLLAIFSAGLAWGCVSFFKEVPVLIFFTVVLTHDVSYMVLVWFIGRRDKVLTDNHIKWNSIWSVPGSIVYLLGILIVSRLVVGIHAELVFDLNKSYFLIGTLFNDLTNDSTFLIKLGWAIFFVTQGHHYFIDRYLWKKEKDFSYILKKKKVEYEQ
jgi:hypothetical protein